MSPQSVAVVVSCRVLESADLQASPKNTPMGSRQSTPSPSPNANHHGMTRDKTPLHSPRRRKLPASQPANSPAKSSTAGGDWEDWDDEDYEVETPSAPVQVAPTKFAGVASDRGMQIGGAEVEEKLNSALKCTSCGYIVIRFPGVRWHRNADYYWFRNHTPDSRMPLTMEDDMNKLTTKLVLDPACAAYACGCSWQSVAAPMAIVKSGTPPQEPGGGARLEAGDMLLWGAKTSYL